MAEEEEPIEEPEEGEPGEEEETPTEEPVVEPKKEQQKETARKPQGGPIKEEHTCPHCRATVRPVAVDTDRGVRYRCPECNKFMTLAEKKPEEVTRESIYEEESDPNKILREILEKNPDVKQAHVEEVMDWAHYSGQLTPGDVVQILTSMKGVNVNLAQIIGRKYLLALSKEMGVKASPLVFGGIPQQQGGFNMPWPTLQAQQPSPYGPYQPPYQPPRQSSPYQGRSANPDARSGLSKEEVVEILKAQNKEREFEETKRELETLKKGGGTPGKEKAPTLEDFERMMDERDERVREGSEKNALMETLNLIRRGMDNLNTRISTIERSELPKKSEEGESFDKKIREAIAKDISDRITGAKGELKPDQIRTIVSDEVRRHAPPPLPPPPSGKRNQYDMEVEKATHNAEARKIEAEEKRKGYEAIAGGIRDGFGSLGWNIGAGASGGPTRSGPSPEAQTEARAPAAEPQPMGWRDGLWYTRCVYSDCRAPMAFEDGKSTVMCPTCRRVIQVQPTEEELKQKVSAEKSKTPETKIEAKKEEPKHEEPRREEEKPPETEKPGSAEEKPITEAKPKVPEASEGSNAKAAEEASGPAS